MNKYRKNPVTIEAIQYTKDTTLEVQDWVGSYYSTWFEIEDDGTISIETIEGAMHVSWGDWVIRGVEGEFYPCKDTIFKKTYTLCEL